MININILDIAKAVGGVLIGDPNSFVKGVSIDSRKIDTNNLYIPIVGKNNDGHNYIEDVVKKNVTCFLVQKDHKRPNYMNTSYVIVDDTIQALKDLAAFYIKQINPYVIAVTGSNGKTSSKDMLYSIMSKKYKTAKTSGNQNNEIGVPLSILDFERDIKCAVIEMGVENPNDINELCKIVKPNVALITCVGSAHIKNFNNSKKEIADAKLQIYTNLKNNGYMFYNVESKELDEQLDYYIDSSKPCYEFGDNSDLMIEGDIKISDGQTSFHCTGFTRKITINAIGRHQVMNALGCIGIGLHEGISKNDIIDALAHTSFEKMRLELIPYGKSLIIDDTYKSNPESVYAALETLKEFKTYKKIVCLGDMLDLGKNQVKYHKEVGLYIRKEDFIDDLICTGELSVYIAEKGDGKWFETKEECAKYLRAFKKSEAVILIKGSRSMEMDKIVNILRNEA